MHAPKGKIARLPADIRNQLNEMLSDGLAYHNIVAWLEEHGHPGFNEMNISRWREGAYQAWLISSERGDQREFLRELADKAGPDDSTFHDAGVQLAQIQFFEALTRLEGADLALMVKENRKEFIQLLKTFTQFNRYRLQRDRFKNELNQQEKAEHERNQPTRESLSDDNLERICAKFNLK
jgi:Protein of unknown function (DUF3486)